MQPSIAAVIPAYNAEKTIETAIKSILHQSVPVDEIIIVNDGSTDNTETIVKQYDGQLTLINQANQGSSVARQAGTVNYTTDYIAFLDSDDWWPVDKISKFRTVLKNETVDFLFADFHRYQSGREDKPGRYLPRNSTFFPWAMQFVQEKGAPTKTPNLYCLAPEDALSLLLHNFPAFPSTYLVSRSASEAIKGWDKRFLRCQDFDFVLRISRHFPVFYFDEIQATIGLPYENNGDALNYLIKQTHGDIHVLETHLKEEYEDSKYRRLVAQSLGRNYLKLSKIYKKRGEKEKARNYCTKCLKFPGSRLRALFHWI